MTCIGITSTSVGIVSIGVGIYVHRHHDRVVYSDMRTETTVSSSSIESMCILVILMLIGFLAFDLVYIAVAVNYCAQCQLLIFLIRGMNERIEEKNITLRQAIRVRLSLLDC